MRLHSNGFRPLVLALVVQFLLAPLAPLGAQTFATPTGEAQNVRFEQRESGIVEIFYDLIASDPRATFTVALEGSQDNGGTWDMRPKTMTGDVGPGITPGTGKKIVWDSGKDMERIQFNTLRFRMAATGGRLAANTAKPAAPPANSQQAVNQQSGGGGGKKKLLIIGGGVVAAGVTAAVLLAGGKPAAPTVTASSITGNNGTLLASVSPLTFRVSVSNPESESLTASFNFGDGTTGSAAVNGGEASVSKTYTAAGTYNPTVTINGGKGGTATASFAAVSVASLTGRWIGQYSAGSITFQISQNGTTLTGDGSIDFASNFVNPGQVSGSVSGPPARITFGLTDRDGRRFPFDLTGSADLRTFTGTIGTGAGDLAFSMTKQ